MWHTFSLALGWVLSLSALVPGGPPATSAADASRALLLDEEGPGWLVRAGELRLVRLAGTREERAHQLGALLRRGVEENVDRFVGDGRRIAELAREFRRSGAGSELGPELDALAAGSGWPRAWFEALHAVDPAPPRLSEDDEPSWPAEDARGEPILVLDTEGRLEARWAGMLRGVAVDAERFATTSRGRALLGPKPGGFDVDNGWPSPWSAVLAVETGSVTDRPLHGAPPRDEAEAAKLAAFVRERESFPYRLLWRSEAPKWRIGELEFPSGLPSGQPHNDLVRARYYQGAREDGDTGLRPGLILLHHLQENFVLEESVARVLCARGVDVVVLILPYYGPRHPPRQRLQHLVFGRGAEGLRAIAAQTAADVARARDWLARRDGIAAVHLAGISLGGIFSALVAGVDGDWPKVAPLLAGGELASILTADSGEARGIRRELERVGLELDDLLASWSALDPIAFAGRVRAETVWMVNATEDDVIPRASTEALWRAFGEPRISWFEGGHVSVGRHLPAILDELVAFLLAPS